MTTTADIPPGYASKVFPQFGLQANCPQGKRPTGGGATPARPDTGLDNEGAWLPQFNGPNMSGPNALGWQAQFYNLGAPPSSPVQVQVLGHLRQRHLEATQATSATATTTTTAKPTTTEVSERLAHWQDVVKSMQCPELVGLEQKRLAIAHSTTRPNRSSPSTIGKPSCAADPVGEEDRPENQHHLRGKLQGAAPRLQLCGRSAHFAASDRTLKP